MKIALYIEDGLEQIVLTPESDTERAILGKLHGCDRELTIKQGAFYECRGGWTRHAELTWAGGVYSPPEPRNDESTIIVMRAKAGEPAQ